MPPAILKIASRFMGDYEIVEEEERPEEPILTEQRYWVVRENEKIEALVRLIDYYPDFYGLVFTQTKADADMVARQLDERGYDAAALHGDIPQTQREKILYRFRNRKTRILVATDVAARGIDIEGLTHVVNYALPFDGPTYIHRIGRTGRAGAKGLAFTMVRPEERRRVDYLRAASLKATKGVLKEAPIPSIPEVLAIKREHLFAEMKCSLGLEFSAENELTAGVPDNCQREELSEAVADYRQHESVVDESFLRMADDLCASRDPKAVLAAVLSLNYGRALDASRYGEITPLRVFNAGKQTRLYVQLGRRDGFNPREIAAYFSGLLHISQRMVDRIDVAENFSLVNLPAQAAADAIERSRRDSTIPHMHIDTRESGTRTRSFVESGFSGTFGERRKTRDDDRVSSRGGRTASGSKRNSPRATLPQHASSSRTSNAGLYKRQRAAD
jgi:ATP-dependent RNA helicase DeaD